MLNIVILAAGKGTRMKSDLPKVLHKVNGKEMIKYVIELSQKLKSNKIILVVGHQAELVEAKTKDYKVEYALQEEQNGTGHAVMMTAENLKDEAGSVLILCGDAPLLREESLADFIAYHQKSENIASVLSTKVENPFGYGRIIRDEQGNFTKIIEEKDASAAEKEVEEINSGVFIVNKIALFESLAKIKADNAQKEYYLTDIIKILKSENKKVGAFMIADYREILGINSIDQLEIAENILKERN